MRDIKTIEEKVEDIKDAEDKLHKLRKRLEDKEISQKEYVEGFTIRSKLDDVFSTLVVYFEGDNYLRAKEHTADYVEKMAKELGAFNVERSYKVDEPKNLYIVLVRFRHPSINENNLDEVDKSDFKYLEYVTVTD